MILAAGLGTRLRPLTDTRPKALVEINGRSLLDITLTRLRSFGVNEVIINVHHFADMVVDYLHSQKNFGMRIEISREDILLDTGGGLKKAARFFLDDPARLDEPFILHNVDVLSNIDLAQMLQFHSEHRALATLAVQPRESSRLLLFDEHLQLRGRRINNRDSLASDSSSVGNGAAVGHFERREKSASNSSPVTHHSSLLQPLAFSGIHIISPRLLPLLTEAGVFSIIDSYLRLASQNQKILAFLADQYYWRDLGRAADVAQATQDIEKLFK
jgi:NDP-sugar pyrophosphorylase family protein